MASDNRKKGRIVFISVFVALTQTLDPLTEDAAPWVQMGFQNLYLLQIGEGLLIPGESPATLWSMVGQGVLSGAAATCYAFNPLNTLAQLGGYITFGSYQTVVIGVLLRYIFTTRNVTRDVIYAACAV